MRRSASGLLRTVTKPQHGGLHHLHRRQYARQGPASDRKGGQCVVDSLVKATEGEELPKNIDTGFYWYDKSNMADPNIAAVLYD